MGYYTTAAFNQTAETTPNKMKKKLGSLDAEAQAAQRQYGDQFGTTVKLQGAQRRAAEQEADKGELQRRQEATGGLTGLADTISSNRSNISNATEAALTKNAQFNTSLSEKQRQAGVTDELTRKESMDKTNRELAGQDFASYKSAAQRSDAITNAWVKGTLDMDLQKAAQEGKLKVFDIQKISSLYQNAMKNTMADMNQDFEAKRDTLMKQYERLGRAYGQAASGITDIIGSILNRK